MITIDNSYRVYIVGMVDEYAKQCGIEKTIIVKFSTRLKRWLGMCQYKHSTLVLNDWFIRNNLFNKPVLDNLLIHEILHFKYPRHTKAFYEACKKMGIDGEDCVPGTRHNPVLEYVCRQCGMTTSFYIRQDKRKCHRCGGRLRYVER